MVMRISQKNPHNEDHGAIPSPLGPRGNMDHGHREHADLMDDELRIHESHGTYTTTYYNILRAAWAGFMSLPREAAQRVGRHVTDVICRDGFCLQPLVPPSIRAASVVVDYRIVAKRHTLRDTCHSYRTSLKIVM